MGITGRLEVGDEYGWWVNQVIVYIISKEKTGSWVVLTSGLNGNGSQALLVDQALGSLGLCGINK